MKTEARNPVFERIQCNEPQCGKRNCQGHRKSVTVRESTPKLKKYPGKPTSFQYQTAIQQITAQEQGEAGAMLAVFEGCWYLEYHPLLWDWICGALCALGLLCGIVGYVSIGIASDFF